MDLRIESVHSLLKLFPNILDKSKTSIIACSKLHITYAIDQIDKLIILLQQLPLKLNSDNITEEKIEDMKDQAASLLPKRFRKEVWGHIE